MPDLTHPTMHFAHPNRRVCKPGEYIVISAEGNTLVVQGADSAWDALVFRINQIDPVVCHEGVWLVTTGLCTHRFAVNENAQIFRMSAEWLDEIN